MKIQLQKFAHKKSPYSRPNQNWCCGKHPQGYQCDAGPDDKGHCRTTHECIPYKSESGSLCGRAKSRGGTCTEGPLPNGECCKKIISCTPIRSLKGKKIILIKWVSFFTLALLLLFLTSSLKTDILSPGELSFKHEKITECKTCHNIFHEGYFNWVKQALADKNTDFSNGKCLDCHQFGKHAQQAHGLTPQDLKQITDASEINNKQLSCLNCHLEHHGKESNLTDVAKQNCAHCHTLSISPITPKHPKFKHYPYKRNTRIIFDHTTHAKKYYFNKAGDSLLETAPNSCISCHQSDKNGIKMLQNSYENDCKACHNETFEESESVVIFDLPELAFNAEELNTEWPEDANGTLTNYMVLLLASDPLFKQAIVNYEGYIEVTELNKKSTLKLTRAIKNLFYDLDSKGPIIFKQRIEKLFDCPISSNKKTTIENSLCEENKAELEQLIILFPAKLLCEAKTRWFPHLNNEYTSSPQNHFCKNTQMDDTHTISGEWLLEDFSIEYRAIEHKDIFLKTWLNLTRKPLKQKVEESTRINLFNELISEDSTVQCTKCHSVESTAINNFMVNWPSNKYASEHKEFIKFKHSPHVKYQEENICDDCHQENKKTDYLESYKDQDPLTFVSNFTTNNDVCLSCHKKSMTESQCQVCHNYHISSTLLLKDELNSLK